MIRNKIIKPIGNGVLTMMGLRSNYQDFWGLVWFHVFVNGFMIWLSYISNAVFLLYLIDY